MDITNDQDPNNLIVQQSNRLIRSRQFMTSNEKKLVSIGIAYTNSHSFYDTIEIHEDDIRSLLNLKNAKGFSSDLKALSKKLMSRVIEMPLPDGGFEQYHWVRNCKYEPSRKTFSFKWDESLAPHIAVMSRDFSRWGLANTMEMESFYASRLYENLKSEIWKKPKGVLTVRYSLVPENLELDYLGDLLGYKGKSYEQWANVRRRVVDQAVKEINSLSDIEVIDIKPLKDGKKVVAIEIWFRASQKPTRSEMKLGAKALNLSEKGLPGNALKLSEKHPAYSEVLRKLVTLGLSSKDASQALSQYGVEYVVHNIGYCMKLERMGQVKSSLSGLVRKALNEDFAKYQDLQVLEGELAE